MTQQRGEFQATLTTKIFPSSSEEYWLGEIKRNNWPVIYITSYEKKNKTEKEMRDVLKSWREKSLEKDSNIEEREKDARRAEAQLGYFKERYGADSKNRPKILD